MKHKNYDVNELRAFFEVARHGSFQRAAHSLSLSPSALSRRIASLEAVLEVSLFSRTTRSVLLTSAGQRLREQALPLLQALDNCVQQVAWQGSGTLAVACISSAAMAVFPDALRRFRQYHPDIRIDLFDDTGLRVQQQVASGRAGFGLATLCHPGADIYAEPLLADPYVLALPVEHPWSQRPYITWRELYQISGAGWPLVGLRQSSANRRQIDEQLLALGISAPWFDEVEHLASILGLLRCKNSVVVMPRLALATCAEWGICSVPLREPCIERTIALIRRRESELSRGEQLLWQLLREQLLTLPAAT
ncbi:LysR family transcriptional regulator [Shimwellia blattae]|uniref:Putative transcriptional regulator n=1 Tax=Shimwellia blattae (strain ATCC 29907 / DSM 4481 / JCM 1650 / NBRC 105725 / CDC 9005-74) TaxID=630626 RepID=I2BEN7_SHIBC|nr:LysR family transcriptional regulator [Shimwellia blattae]AFJ48991.1 putative transcriptional regulator [Shimwellia blattae DSM 4481 = NBRC 105725]GAB82315.1 putative LysR family transcriptional regulator YbhD [Shimwellia blattae DSM 4481 = NBRC 105725]VDY66476.1 Cyn operon transcriptional activator [Shimwellia blattae]VEC28396.1 Cyn operon transcriptional activator [Shimwellia blattae]